MRGGKHSGVKDCWISNGYDIIGRLPITDDEEESSLDCNIECNESKDSCDVLKPITTPDPYRYHVTSHSPFYRMLVNSSLFLSRHSRSLTINHIMCHSNG